MKSLTYPDTQLQEFDRVRDLSPDKGNRAIDASTRGAIGRATAGGRAAIEALEQGRFDAVLTDLSDVAGVLDLLRS